MEHTDLTQCLRNGCTGVPVVTDKRHNKCRSIVGRVSANILTIENNLRWNLNITFGENTC